jgi:hypothetical protein
MYALFGVPTIQIAARFHGAQMYTSQPPSSHARWPIFTAITIPPPLRGGVELLARSQ